MPLFARVWILNEGLIASQISRRLATSTSAVCLVWLYQGMAFIDLHQLVFLYKLCHTDTCFPQLLSHLPPMATTRSHPRVRTRLKTHNLNHNVVYDAPTSTPISRGTSVRKRQEDDADKDVRFKREDYDDYIREDFESRVFVDFEVFMKTVLHVPDNWKDAWGPAIAEVKTDTRFTKCHREYCEKCDQPGLHEKSFYEPFVDTANAVLTVLSESQFAVPDIASESESGGIAVTTPQYYRVNDPKKLLGGVINKNNLSPDLVVLHDDCRPPKERKHHWANPLHVLEVKPYDSAICDGENITRLISNGKPKMPPFHRWRWLTRETGIDPILNHAPPPSPARYRADKAAKEATPIATPTTNSFANFSKSRKRRADESHTHNQRASKKLKTLSRQFRKRHGSTRPGAQEGSKASSPPTPETEVQACPALQVCRYLLEMFSVPLLRSHATVCLIDRDRLQLYHANRSVILVSSAINFSNNEDLDKFIAVIFAFQRLTPEQNGILDAFPSSNIELVKNPNIPEDYRVVQNGNVLHLSTYNEEESFEISLGDVISRDPAVIGRSTVVLKATSDKWPDTNLVAKVSWPSSGRVSETKFIEKAIEEAEKTEGEWATNHLPRMFFSKEFVFNEKSTFESTARLFEASKFFPRNYAFERRVLRIIIQEELYPLKSLSNVRDLGQVFVDVACSMSSFSSLIVIHLPWSSSPLASRCPWDPSP